MCESVNGFANQTLPLLNLVIGGFQGIYMSFNISVYLELAVVADYHARRTAEYSSYKHPCSDENLYLDHL
jgi:hypothetical protein